MESGFSFHDSAEVLNTILTDQPEVDYVLSGMSNEERLLDNIRTMRDFNPLSDDERVVIEQVIGVLRGVSSAHLSSVCQANVMLRYFFALATNKRS